MVGERGSSQNETIKENFRKYPFHFGLGVGTLIVLAVACYFIIKYNIPCAHLVALILIILIIVIALIAYCWIPRNLTCQEQVFWFGVGIILTFIVGSTCIWDPSRLAPQVFVPCEEQKTYAIESIKIHTDFVHGLTQGILLARQASFVVITGLLLYYFVKNEKKTTGIGNGGNETQENRNKLKRETLLLFFSFSFFLPSSRGNQ